MSLVVDSRQAARGSLDLVDCKLFSTASGLSGLSGLSGPFFSTDSMSYLSNGSSVPSPSSVASSFELPSKDAPPRLTAAEDVSNRSPDSPRVAPLSFPSLPADIHHLILTDYLPYDSILALRSTSSHFRSLAPPVALKRLRRKIVSDLLAQERVLLRKWIPQPYGRLDGRPSTHITCYSCLQYLPITEFVAKQVTQSRALGRKRASERWCKACGIKQGKIKHGTWMSEVTYGYDDQARYEAVMDEELKVSNPCVTCPPRGRFLGQLVWWGCVDCFEKEEKRRRLCHATRRRDLRHHYIKAVDGTKAFFEPENLRDLGQEFRWKMSLVFSRSWFRRGYRIDWWALEQSVLRGTCRGCVTVVHCLDPRQVKKPAESLGKKAKTGLKNVMGRARGSGQSRGGATEAYEAHEDCLLCGAAAENNSHLHSLRAAKADPSTLTPSTIDPPPPIPSDPQHSPYQQQRPGEQQHNHIFAPHREVRCWRCWRPERSRRRRRRDDGMVYGSPLPKDRWCDSCVAEHDRSIAMRKARKAWWNSAEEAESGVVRSRDEHRSGGELGGGDALPGESQGPLRVLVDGEEVSVGLGRLFAET